MQFDFASILVFIALGVGFLGTTLLLGSLVRPSTPDADKMEIYECGERPIRQAWFNFNPRFYIVALIFLIFDVEVAFTYPVATVFRRWVAEGNGLLALAELAIFIGILGLGLAYVWAKGDLEWIRLAKHDRGFEVARSQNPGTPFRPDTTTSDADAPDSTSHSAAA